MSWAVVSYNGDVLARCLIPGPHLGRVEWAMRPSRDSAPAGVIEYPSREAAEKGREVFAGASVEELLERDAVPDTVVSPV